METEVTDPETRYSKARAIYNEVKRDGQRVLTLPEIQRVIEAHEARLVATVEQVRNERDAAYAEPDDTFWSPAGVGDAIRRAQATGTEGDPDHE